jgi:hypothetical protein
MAREIGANGIIIDKSQPIKSGFISTGIYAKSGRHGSRTEIDQSFRPAFHPQSQSLPEILDLVCPIANSHRRARIGQGQVDCAVVVAFDDKFCSIL